MLKMVVTPSAALLEKAKPVDKFDKKLKQIIWQMQEALDATIDPIGVGLAAPQVGISKRIFLAKPKEDGSTHVIINPKIIHASEGEEIPILPNSKKVELMKKMAEKKFGVEDSHPNRKGTLLEGCLSVPNIWGNVSRKKRVKLEFQDINGKKHIKTFTGFLAIIIQHELDHLNGILFTKHVLAQKEQLYRSYKNAEGEDEFEEIEV